MATAAKIPITTADIIDDYEGDDDFDDDDDFDCR